tara:strand:- start:1294 stop:1875 length:582 start_codon:yes stop_codon:yes gene_type:complete
MGFLCKEQVIKGLYLAIGSKHDLPKDLLLIIYHLTKDDSEVREYHTDAVFRNTIPNYAGSVHLPLGRGLEWAIKWAPHGQPPKASHRQIRHTQIQVFGDRDYLLKRTEYSRDAPNYLVSHFADAPAEPAYTHFYERSHKKLKLLYLNNSPADEVLDDYLNYLESDRDPGQRLYIDNFGEAIDCIGHDEIFIDS